MRSRVWLTWTSSLATRVIASTGSKSVDPRARGSHRTNFEHPDLALARVDKEIAYVTDLFIMPIDHFAIADVLIRVCKGEFRFAQLFKFSIRRRLRLAHHIVLSYLGGREVRCRPKRVT